MGMDANLVRKKMVRSRFYLQNIGELKAIYHRPIPEDAVLKHVVVKRVNSKWYVCLMLALPDPQPKPVPTGKAIGIDLGLQFLLATSAGDRFANPRWLRRACLEKLSSLGNRVVTIRGLPKTPEL
jgi:putative transposase